MVAASPIAAPTRMTDSHGRVIHDLRVSITDRCNYKCVYCRTGEVGAQYPELKIDEYLRLITLFVGLGVEKVRLTGGEPLLRHGLLDLIRELARLRTLTGEPLDLALTTNGHLLEDLAKPLKTAGLQRATVSMDAVDAGIFERITRVPGSYSQVLRGIRAARDAGLTPLKINCVLMRGFNDDQVENFAHFAREEDVAVRFIEFMPLEEGRLWSPEIVVPFKEIVERINRILPLVPVPRARSERDGAAVYLRRRQRRDRDHRAGHAGILWCVQPGSAHFGRQDQNVSFFPSRARPLRKNAGRRERLGIARAYIGQTVQGKEARHHIGEPGFLKPSRSMVHIGG